MTEVTCKDLKEGDRIEITLKGRVASSTGGSAAVVFDGGADETPILARELAQAKITLLEPELKEGRAKTASGAKGRVVYIDGNVAWFRYDGGTNAILHVEGLCNIPEDTDKGDQS